MDDHITIVAMTSSVCNLDCPGCYMKATRTSAEFFNPSQIPLLVRNCAQGFKNVEFCWHGGEPILVGKDFYRKALNEQKKISEVSGVEFRNVMQTNGTLLDEAWIAFLKENKISFGFSYDAPPSINALQRGNDGEKVVAAWKLAKQAGLPVGVICVISKHNVGKAKEIFDFFSENGVTSYSFLPLRSVPAPNLPTPPDNKELFQLLRETFDIWASQESDITEIDPLSTMIKGLISGYSRTCSFNGSCPEQMVAIDQNGNVIPCGSLVAKDFMMGNILKEPLKDILQRKAQPLVQLRQDATETFCKGCKYLPICCGGCRADAYWETGSYAGAYPYCEARKLTFQYLENQLKNLGIPLFDICE
jgi:uncharacterized protein